MRDSIRCLWTRGGFTAQFVWLSGIITSAHFDLTYFARSSSELRKNQLTDCKYILLPPFFIRSRTFYITYSGDGDGCIWDFTPVIPSYTILPLLIKNIMALLHLRALQVNFSTTVKTTTSYTAVVHVMQKRNAPFLLADKRYRFDYATLTIHLPPFDKAKSTHSITTLKDKTITYSLPEKSQEMINYLS